MKKDIILVKNKVSYKSSLSISNPEQSGQDFKTKVTIVIDDEVVFSKHFFGVDEWQSFFLAVKSLKARLKSLIKANSYRVFDLYHNEDVEVESIFFND